MKKIDIVLPCYNPPLNWVENIETSSKAICSNFLNYNISFFIINDGSPSINSQEVKRLKQIESMHWHEYKENRGKGFALRQGVAMTTADIVIYTDIDFPYELESMLSVIKALIEEENDIVVGVRPNSYYKKVPWTRQIISKTLRFFIRFFIRMKITDTQCGIKGFNKLGRAVFLKTTIDRYLFDLEFIFLASQKKELRLKPVEVHLKPNILFRAMDYRILLTEGKNFFKVLLKSFFQK
jgi:glycosyltransferase involved in cell wall biosynthesis